MNQLNTFIAYGQITSKIREKHLDDGSRVVEFILFVHDTHKPFSIQVKVYDEALVGVTMKYGRQGGQVLVTGKLAKFEWVTVEGQAGERLYVVSRDVQFLR